MNSQQLGTVMRYATGIAVALVLIVLLVVIGISLYRGISEPQIVGLATVVATLVALLVALLGSGAAVVSITGVDQKVGSVQGQVADVQAKVNGHLDAHQVQNEHMQDVVDKHLVDVTELIDRRLSELGLVPPPAPPPAPPAGPPGGVH